MAGDRFEQADKTLGTTRSLNGRAGTTHTERGEISGDHDSKTLAGRLLRAHIREYNTAEQTGDYVALCVWA